MILKEHVTQCNSVANGCVSNSFWTMELCGTKEADISDSDTHISWPKTFESTSLDYLFMILSTWINEQISHPLQQAHLLEVGAGVGQSLQSVRQVKVGAEVEAVCSQHIVEHGQESLILLRLEEEGEEEKTNF